MLDIHHIMLSVGTCCIQLKLTRIASGMLCVSFRMASNLPELATGLKEMLPLQGTCLTNTATEALKALRRRKSLIG